MARSDKIFEAVNGKTAFEYGFSVNENDNGRRVIRLTEQGQEISQYLREDGTAKIYVVVESREIIYVGGTCDDLLSRLRSGINEPYPYLWVSQRLDRNLKLVVFLLPDVYCNARESNQTARGIEAVEAELVFFIRVTGRWPRGQTEVHFRQTVPETLEVALNIARYLKNHLADNIVPTDRRNALT